MDAGQRKNVPALPCLWSVSLKVSSCHLTGVAQIRNLLERPRHAAILVVASVNLKGPEGLGLTINVVSEDPPVTTATFYLMQSIPEDFWWGCVC
jgi:hypothetical protein